MNSHVVGAGCSETDEFGQICKNSIPGEIPPVVTPEKHSISIIDEPPVYHNLQQDYEGVTSDPMDASLHTISSEASIDLNLLFDSAAEVYAEIKEELSLRASQLDSSDLRTSNTVNIIPDDSPTKFDGEVAVIAASASHDFDTLVSVSQQLLKSDGEGHCVQSDNEKELPPSFCAKNKGMMIGVVIMGLVVQLFSCLVVIKTENEEATETIHAEAVTHEDETFLTVGGTSYRKESLDLETASDTWTLMHFILFAIVTKVIKQRFFKAGSRVKVVADSAESKDALEDAEVNSIAGSDSSSVTGTREEDNSDANSIPSLIPIPNAEDEIISTYDLSKLQVLKTPDLRALLKSKNCGDTTGNKPDLIRRLVSAYRIELQNKTVVQLRQQLKSYKLKQSGRKHELIQRLVEAGISANLTK